MANKKAIFILSGWMVQEDGKWRTTRFDEKDPECSFGDRLRVESAYVLYSQNDNVLLIVSGSKGKFEDVSGAPTIASIIRKELIALGVAEKSIILDEKSGTTWQQLQELKRIIKDYNLSRIKILSNRYHLPRVQAMIEKNDELFALLREAKIELVSAEEVLIENDSKQWKEKIDKAYKSKEMKKRIAKEQEGVRQIKKGTYTLK